MEPTQKTIKTWGLSLGSLFKLVCIGVVFSSLFFAILLLLLIWLFPHAVEVMDSSKSLTVQNLLVVLPLWAITQCGAIWLILSLGHFIYSRWWTLTITYKTIPDISGQNKE